MIFYLPNIISLLRVLISPFFLYMLVWGGDGGVSIACLLYFIGSATDFFDGWIARRYHIVSKWGKFFDPLADKILTTAAFAGFVLLEIIPLWMVVIVLIRDFGTTFLRVWADLKDKTIITSFSAKWKTFLQMLFIGYILVLLLMKDIDYITINIFATTSEAIHSLLYSSSTYYLMLLLTVFAIWTAIEYFLQNKNLLGISAKES